jgi:putative ABC transport system permease protein
VPTFDQIDAELAALPGVESVARISGLPLGTSENVLNFIRTDKPVPDPGQVPAALYRVVDPDYFLTMSIPLLAGRMFEQSDRNQSPRVAIVSRELADTYFPGEDPIGRTIRLNGPDPVQIVGIAANVRSQRLQDAAAPELYVPHAQAGSRAITFVVKSPLEPPQVLNAAREVVRRLDARLPLVFPSSMRELESAALSRPRFYFWLLAAIAALSVTLAAVGIYGVVAYAVTQRTREIGVRMALGAGRPEVVALMVWYGLRPSIVGVVAGLAIAAGASRLIEGLLYEVRPADPVTFVIVTATLLLVAGLACAFPALRASRVPPSEALRGE